MRDQHTDRIERLKQAVEALGGTRVHAPAWARCPPGEDEKYWNELVAFEYRAEVEPFEVFRQAGIALPAPSELDDVSIALWLWQLVDDLALLGVYLEFTDHLSDRELYARLWTDVLRRPTQLDIERKSAMLVDVDQGNTSVYLKYYADERTREEWGREWPDDAMPAHEPLPFDRDRHLPRPEWYA
jgi:hypothetical protein